MSPELAILHDVARRALALFDLPDNCTVTLVNQSENTTFKISAPDQQRWALRIHRPGYHSLTAINSELAWMKDLRAKGIVITPKPVPNRNGLEVQTIRHPELSHPRHVVLFEWEAGTEPVISQNLAIAFQALGKTTALMHNHARQWQRPVWFERHTWNFETALGETNPHWGRWRDGIGVTKSHAKLFETTVVMIGRRLTAYGTDPDRFGLIHGDTRLANLLVDGTTVKVIDFDDAGFGWFMYDAATTVSFHEHDSQVPELLAAWKDGYRKVNQLSKADEIEIATFLMLRRLLLVAWAGSHANTELARSLGRNYTDGTMAICEDFLSRMA